MFAPARLTCRCDGLTSYAYPCPRRRQGDSRQLFFIEGTLGFEEGASVLLIQNLVERLDIDTL